jgi:hypothetical protein
VCHQRQRWPTAFSGNAPPVFAIRGGASFIYMRSHRTGKQAYTQCIHVNRSYVDSLGGAHHPEGMLSQQRAAQGCVLWQGYAHRRAKGVCDRRYYACMQVVAKATSNRKALFTVQCSPL